MLDFNRLIQPLTQGQPPADMTLLQAPQPGEAVTPPQAPAPSATASAAPGTPTAHDVDARLLAERVYQLMRQELRVQNERRAGH